MKTHNMRFIYSPYFGSRPYVDLKSRSSVMLSEAPVGTPALLHELELRTGTVPGQSATALDRLVGYVRAMRLALLDEHELFFANSFANDEVGTAKVLLTWRDALKMALWTPDIDMTEKLRGLARIEEHFSGGGYADRWVALLDRLEHDETGVPDGIEIECRVPLEVLDPCVRRVLETLRSRGLSVTVNTVKQGSAPEGTALRIAQDTLLSGSGSSGRKQKLPADGSLLHVPFRFGQDAARWAALSAESWAKEGRLVACARPCAMNGALRFLGRPLLSNDAAGLPQSAQLFLLGIALFRNPVDVRRLLSYLRAPVCPVGGLYLKKTNAKGEPYFRSLSNELADMLLRNGGLENWAETIAAAVYDREGNELDKKRCSGVLGRFRMWEQTSGDGRVPASSLGAWLANMRGWADAMSHVFPDDTGFTSLSSYCAAMSSLLADAPESIPYDRIVRWAEGIINTESTTVDVAGNGTPDCVSDLCELLDGPSSVVWMGAAGGEPVYPYGFLSREERMTIGAPDPETSSRAGHDALVQAICRIRKGLAIVSYECEDGAVLTAHPLLTELFARFDIPSGEADDMAAAAAGSDTRPVPEARAAKGEYQVDSNLFDGLKKRRSEGGLLPDHESQTSIDQLIQYPFDYVLEVLLGFEGYGEEQISDLPIVKGNVAHRYVQDLVESCGGDLAKMEKMHFEEFIGRVEAASLSGGASLRDPENGLEWGKFCDFLRRSVTRLLNLIKDNGLRIVASEKKVEAELPVIGPFHGYIDLLLRDRQGRLVIFDFKWNEGSRYNKKMEERDILQLILYKEAVKRCFGEAVSAYGYWIFPRFRFLTESPSIHGSDVDQFRCDDGVAPDTDDIFLQICNSYAFRMKQIRRGLIEEGEGLRLADLEYGQKQGTSNLYPLRHDYDNHDIKGRPYGNTNITLKGGLE